MVGTYGRHLTIPQEPCWIGIAVWNMVGRKVLQYRGFDICSNLAGSAQDMSLAITLEKSGHFQYDGLSRPSYSAGYTELNISLSSR